MNQEELLAQLKKDVRSLLISSKLGLEVEKLRRDYVSMLGHPMPLKQLGFRNIMEMVKEMPDVVAINFTAEGNLWLTAVGDESTRNIEELVANQRKPKPNKNVKRHHFTPRPFSLRPTMVLPRRGGTPLAVPADLRTQLRILLSQGPILTSDLESSFQRCFGYPLRPQNYGFYSTGELLEAATDLIHKHQTRLGSAVSLREHKLPSVLPIPFTTPRKTGQINPVPGRAARNTHMLDTGHKLTVKSQAPAFVKPANQLSTGKTTESVCKMLTLATRGLPTAEKSQGEPEVCKNDGLYHKQVLKLEEELRQKIVENGVAGTISQELKDKLRKVVCESSGGLSVHCLPAEYKRLFGEDLPLQQNGFASVTEMVSALIDTFHLKPVNDESGQQWKVMGILHNDIMQSDPKVTRSLDEPSASNDLIDNIVHPKVTRSLDEPSASNDLIDSESSCKRESEQEKDDASICERTKTSNSFKTPQMVHCRSTVPPDAVQSQRLKKARRLSPRELVQVQVEEVDSPGHFYISFSNSEEAQAMDNMMLEMRRCYNCPEVSHPYRLSEPFVRRGQVCCVSPKGLWFYRAVIHQITSPSEVEVYFVDFGSRTVVPITSLKFLKSCYSVLPAQAVPSSLAGIRPPAGGWSADATASFQKMCCARPLAGALECYAGDVLLLYLCDTHTADDVYVHSVLLSQGHGTACSPSAIAPLCVKANPVSLFLGEGMVDLPEIKEESSPKPSVSTSAEEHHLVASHIDNELPGLELIEDAVVSCHHQDSSVFNLSLTDPAVTYNSSDGASSTGSHMTLPPSPSSILFANPDLIQSKTDAARTSDLDEMTTPSQASSTVTAAPCWPASEDKQRQLTAVTPFSFRPPSAVTILSLHTPDLGQCFPGSPLKLRKAGFPFPLFGTM